MACNLHTIIMFSISFYSAVIYKVYESSSKYLLFLSAIVFSVIYAFQTNAT